MDIYKDRGQYPAKKIIHFATLFAISKNRPVGRDYETMMRMVEYYERSAAVLN